jgi:hypothetical protein
LNGSEFYVAIDEEYVSPNEFKNVYEQAARIPRGGTAVRGFINYLKKHEKRNATNREPRTVEL